MATENGFGIGLFRVAYFGHGNKTKFTLVVPDLYKKTKEIRHRFHLPEISSLSLIIAGILHFAAQIPK